MGRFFISARQAEQAKQGMIEIEGSDVRHIGQVLRLQAGDAVTLCDTAGLEYVCEIQRITADRVYAAVKDTLRCETEPEIAVRLYQGIPKGEKMDWLIQKCVELGVTEIIPVLTERTVVKLRGPEDCERKQVRWQRIAAEAAKQCGRGRIPEILFPMPFRAAIRQAPEGLRLMPYENETERTLKQVLRHPDSLQAMKLQKSISVFIGPEGGIAGAEAESAFSAGFIPVSLGKRILRTETAGLAVLAAIRYEFGD